MVSFDHAKIIEVFLELSRVGCGFHMRILSVCDLSLPSEGKICTEPSDVFNCYSVFLRIDA